MRRRKAAGTENPFGRLNIQHRASSVGIKQRTASSMCMWGMERGLQWKRGKGRDWEKAELVRRERERGLLVPRLRESRLLTPSGRGARVHAT